MILSWELKQSQFTCNLTKIDVRKCSMTLLDIVFNSSDPQVSYQINTISKLGLCREISTEVI